MTYYLQARRREAEEEIGTDEEEVYPLLGTFSWEKMLPFGHCPNEGGPAQIIFGPFQEEPFGSIKGLFFFQNANNII